MRRESVIAVNRFGLGAAPGELAAAGGDPRGWLSVQTKTAPEHPAFAGLPPTSEALKEYPRWISSLRLARNEATTMGADGQPGVRGIEQNFRDFFGPGLMKEVGARLSAAAATQSPFHERLALFWANHFTVSAEKPVIFALVGSFEREAIRPHVGGHFVDMLLASSKHPAMIMYLDNNVSVRPGMKLPERPGQARPTGLNENLAREILELHTLGVNGGYTQADVTTFARVLTGWTVGGPASPGFTFIPARHDPGPKAILGKTYADDGIAQGEAVLRDLAAHPATATYIATKLARHFIADEPPAAAVERIAKAFRDTGGHLPAVYAALIESPEAWQAPLAKLKSPIEYIVSCLRAIPAAREAKPQALFFTLREMGQRPFFAPSPQGWPDTAAAWAGADGLWKRIEWAGALAARAGSRIDPLELAHNGYGEVLSEPTRVAISRAESRPQGLALWLASPEFQRR
jgi:uncharacterized protein (DUF1800 family)